MAFSFEQHNFLELLLSAARKINLQTFRCLYFDVAHNSRLDFRLQIILFQIISQSDFF